MLISLNLDRKLVFLVLSVAIITLAITGGLSFNYGDEILKQKTGDQLIGESSVRGETLRLLFESRIEQNNIFASDPMIRLLISDMNEVSENELKKIKGINRIDFLIQIQAFQELIGFSIGFEDVQVIGKNGDMFFSLVGTKNENFSENKFFQNGLIKSFIEFVPVKSGKKMTVVSPVFKIDSKKGDEPIGVIISTMRTDSIDNILLNRSGLGESGEVYIVNNEFLMLSESRFIENVIFQQKVNTVGVQKCFSEGEEHLGFYSDYRDVPIFGSSYCADDLGIVLLVEIDQAEIEKPIKTLQNKILLTGIGIILVMGFVAFVISKSISRPLIKLKSAANKIARGDFDVRTSIKTQDEIGDLSIAFDLMAEKLQESLVEIKQKEKIIKQQEGILLKFTQHTQNDCVGVIDMNNSTKISEKLSDEDMTRLYEIFLNFMAKIVHKHKGEVVKNIGDALMFRFPNVDPTDAAVMKNILECCLVMMESHDKLKEQLDAENLPEIDYKISTTYGSVMVAESTTSNISDIFGPTVNRCFKINSLCPKNSVVVGINLYDILKDFSEYAFAQFCSIEMKQKYDYSIFQVKRK
jgi:class 3 adenylate cyclase